MGMRKRKARQKIGSTRVTSGAMCIFYGDRLHERKKNWVGKILL